MKLTIYGDVMRLVLDNMRRVSNKLTKIIAIIWGNKFPFYYVTEYPRSGGTWVAHMLADYLNISFPKLSIFPLGCECIIHNHWKYHPRLHPVIYVVRDGRDVAISMFFYALHHSKTGENIKYFLNRFKCLKNIRNDRNSIREIFPQFIDEWFKYPAGCKENWTRHLNQWAFGKENVVVVKYEVLRQNTLNELSNIVRRIKMCEPDLELLKSTVYKFSFEKQTGRKTGIENPLSKKRKGISGDWRNYFTKNAGEIFLDYTGDLLIRLGYEKNCQWFKELPRT